MPDLLFDLQIHRPRVRLRDDQATVHIDIHSVCCRSKNAKRSGVVDFLKAIGSGVILIVVVYCDLITSAAELIRKRFTTK